MIQLKIFVSHFPFIFQQTVQQTPLTKMGTATRLKKLTKKVGKGLQIAARETKKTATPIVNQVHKDASSIVKGVGKNVSNVTKGVGGLAGGIAKNIPLIVGGLVVAAGAFYLVTNSNGKRQNYRSSYEPTGKRFRTSYGLSRMDMGY